MYRSVSKIAQSCGPLSLQWVRCSNTWATRRRHQRLSSHMWSQCRREYNVFHTERSPLPETLPKQTPCRRSPQTTYRTPPALDASGDTPRETGRKGNKLGNEKRSPPRARPHGGEARLRLARLAGLPPASSSPGREAWPVHGFLCEGAGDPAGRVRRGARGPRLAAGNLFAAPSLALGH